MYQSYGMGKDLMSGVYTERRFFLIAINEKSVESVWSRWFSEVNLSY
jgi:hypothetical protein